MIEYATIWNWKWNMSYSPLLPTSDMQSDGVLDPWGYSVNRRRPFRNQNPQTEGRMLEAGWNTAASLMISFYYDFGRGLPRKG